MKKKIKEKTYLSPGAKPTHLSRPSPPGGGTCVFFLSRQASRSPASGEGALGSSLLPWPLSPRLETSWRRPASFPFVQSHPPLLPRRLRRQPKEPPERAAAPARPVSLSSYAAVSNRSTAVVYVSPCRD